MSMETTHLEVSNLGTNGNLGTKKIIIPPTGNPNMNNTSIPSIGTFGANSTTSAGTSNMTIHPIITQGYLTKKEFQRLLEQKNKSLNFFEFDLKLPYLTNITARPYPKNYTNPKFKHFNGKIDDTREHVMKFIETLGMAS